MRYIKFIVIVIFFFGYTQRSVGQTKLIKTIICGDIPEARDSVVKVDLTVLYPEDLGNPEHTMSISTINGKFSFEIYLNTPRTFLLEIAEAGKFLFDSGFSRTLIIEPGDDISFQINNIKDLVKSVTIKGQNIAKFDYLREYRSKEYDWYERYFRTVPDSLFNNEIHWQKVAKESGDFKWKLLKEYEQKLSPRIHNIFLALMYTNEYAEKFRDIANGVETKISLNDYLSKNNINLDTIYACLNREEVILSFTDYLPNLIEMIALLKNSNHLMKSINKNYFANKDLDKNYDELALFLKNSKVRDFVLASFIDRKIKSCGLRDDLEYCIESYLKTTSVKSIYYKQISTIYTTSKLAAKLGKPIQDFVFKNTADVNISLKNYEGKVVLIDFWYTGCTNCIAIQPSIKEIYEKFMDSKQLVILSISIDKDKEMWKKSIPLYSNSHAVNLYTGGKGTQHPFIKFFNYNAYPSLVLVGKNGKLIVAPAPRVDTRLDSDKQKMIRLIEQEIAK